MESNILNKRRGGFWSTETFGERKIVIKTNVPDYDGLNRSIVNFDSFDEGQSNINEANAAFICKAVNNYDSLLEALKKLAFQYEESAKMLCADNNLKYDESDFNTLTQAKEAIKKAE